MENGYDFHRRVWSLDPGTSEQQPDNDNDNSLIKKNACPFGDGSSIENVFQMPKMAKFTQRFIQQNNALFNLRKEAIYVIRDFRIIWANQAAIAAGPPHVIGNCCRNVLCTGKQICMETSCHNLRAAFLRQDGGELKTMYPLYERNEQAVCGVVVLKPLGGNHANHVGPVSITLQEQTRTDPQRTGRSGLSRTERPSPENKKN